MDTFTKKILVVDDEPDVRNYLQAVLLDAGFQVETAIDGMDALNKAETFLPDLISLDLVMPKHSGIKLYHDLQKNKQLSKIPVLIVTGHAYDDLGRVDFQTLTMQGTGIYLEKPVKPDKYVRTVCQILIIDVPEKFKNEYQEDTSKLREELERNLANADPDSLKQALELLKSKTK